MNFEKFDDAKKDDKVLNSFTRDQKILLRKVMLQVIINVLLLARQVQEKHI